MASGSDPQATLERDWLELCRDAARRVQVALESYPTTADRAQPTGRGEGGDIALVIDRAAEDAVFEALESFGAGVVAVSEERGAVEIAGGGAVRVVIDPIDGSLNAKRGLPLYCLSIAVAGGSSMDDVELGYVLDLAHGEEWWARRGLGAYLDGRALPLRVPDGVLEALGVDSATPALMAAAAASLEATGAYRLRALGAIALHLCHVASGRLDGMLSLAPCRSVDAAAGQLIAREAGGAVAFPDAADALSGVGLGLDMRSRVFAGGDAEVLERLLDALR